jgi:hypothetical protein
MKYDKIVDEMIRLEKALTALAVKGTNLVLADGDYYDAVNIGDAILNLSSGKNEVVIDDLGRPSVMVNYPINQQARLDYLSNDGTLFTPDGRTLHPAFYVDGVAREFQVSKYLGGRTPAGANTPVSLYGLIPSYSLTLDTMISLCVAMGNNFALSTNAVWSYLMLLSMRLAFQPRGNSQYGKSHAAAEYGEVATISGNNAYLTRTGTGPEAWHLLGSIFEPADMVGNGFERCADLKYVGGKWRIIPDNNAAVAGRDLTASSTLFKELAQDGTWQDPDTSGTLGYDYITTPPVSGSAAFEIAASIDNPQANDNPYGAITFASLGTRSGVTVPPMAYELGLAPCATAPLGIAYMRNNGEKCPFAGGGPDSGSHAGLGCRNGGHSRSTANMSVVFRALRLK